MYIWTSGEARPIEIGRPSPLLSFIAGEFAHQVADLWPAPHVEFLAAPAERRHLICIALAEGGAAQLSPAILQRPLQAAIQLALPEAPAGLGRALGRLGETAWTTSDYRAFVGQLRHPRLAKIWRHAEAVSLDQMRAFARQPALLLDRPGGPLIQTQAAAQLVSECLDAIARRDPAAAAAAVARWASAGDLQGLLRLVRKDLHPPFPEPPVGLGGRYRRLATPEDLQEVARRYQNCVESYLEEAATGRSVLYERQGEPGVVVELARDPVFGWRLEQARLARNAAVEDGLRSEIAEELRTAGVHIGRPFHALTQALAWAHDADFRFPAPEAAIAEVFGA